ncbi:MAG: hypothetical protein ACHP84_17560 [Caulobacterales bacterium]
MAIYARPHSAEWFAALEVFNPRQAAITRTIIELAGRDDVCSVCGDDPASDYRLTAQDLSDDAVATLRLCDDCHEISAMNGEHFIQF